MCPKGHTAECCWYGHLVHNTIARLPDNIYRPIGDGLMVIFVSICLILWFLLIVMSIPFDLIEKAGNRVLASIARLRGKQPDPPPPEPS